MHCTCVHHTAGESTQTFPLAFKYFFNLLIAEEKQSGIWLSRQTKKKKHTFKEILKHPLLRLKKQRCQVSMIRTQALKEKKSLKK